MIVSSKAVVISALKYSDSSLIVKCFTESDGLKSYLLKGILAAKKSKLKAAYFQPLSLLEIVASHKNKGTLESLREVRISFPFQTIHLDIKKNAIAFFISEILATTITEEEGNPELFSYVEAAVQWLDTHSDVANFPLIFLLQLSKFLGFYPDDTASSLACFDLQEGEFVSKPSLNPVISGYQIELFKVLLSTRLDTPETLKASRLERKELLRQLLLYFDLHVQGFRTPRSLEVLQEVFL